MKNIYVGNLDSAASDSQLRELFQAYGAVESVTLVKDRDTGNSRHFAFVEMINDSEAEAAISALNGVLMGERRLSVNEARPKGVGLNGQAPGERRKEPRESLPTRGHRQHRY
jgi:cold-inducible RNA-binding protein